MTKVICVFVIAFLCGSFSQVLSNNVNKLKSTTPFNAGDPPATFDWRDYGMVSPVKDEQNCSAGWAFSTAGALESQIRILNNFNTDFFLMNFSEQFLIDCNSIDAGCGYSDVLNVFENIILKYNYVVTNSTFRPYNGTKKTCKLPKRYSAAPFSGFKKIQNESEIKDHLYQYGPISASINSASMKNYQPDSTLHGIDRPSDEDCPPGDLNHTVLIVGYNEYVSEDSKETIPYWIIKNSWGESWGHDGYYYLERGRNACGIGNNLGIPMLVIY